MSAGQPLAAAALLLFSVPALAQPPVVTVAGEAPSEAARSRVVEELEAQGYEVIQADRDESRVGLSARLIVRSRRIEVRVVNRRNGGVERREAVIQLGPNDDDTANAAIRAAEYLRASLIEVGGSAPQTRAPPARAEPGADNPPPRRPATQPKEPPPSNVHAGLGPGIFYSTGGLPAVPTLEPSIRWRATGSLGARLNAIVPLSSSSVAREQGSVSVKATGFGLSLWWTPARSRWIEPYLDLGITGFFLSMRAAPANGYVGADHSRLMGAVLGGAGLLVFPGRVRLRLGASTGLAFQREHIQILWQPAARWGEWLVSGAALVEASLD